jgi:alpha-D-ribose 1-methylphosphonate 5-triphosphate synthase subunit PhnG
MGSIRDSQGRTIGYLPVDLAAGEETIALVYQVTPAVAGEKLRSASNALVSVHARQHGTGNPFQNLATNPIDLSGLPLNVATQFDVKFVAAGSIAGRQHTRLAFRAASSRPAGWRQ